jgi:hypothetical protein
MFPIAGVLEEEHDADERRLPPIDAETANGNRTIQLKSPAFIGGYRRSSASGC